MVPSKGWLILLFTFSAKLSAERVTIWRKLKKFGSIQLKTSAYILPDSPQHYERFQWLAKAIVDAGGEATLMKVASIEGMSDTKIIEKFNQERTKDYREIEKQVKGLLNKKKQNTNFSGDLEILRGRYAVVQQIDYFGCPTAESLRNLFASAEAGASKNQNFAKLDPKKFQKSLWLTRPRPEVDRVGTAWLIKRFIDPQATFCFAVNPNDYPKAIPFDMKDVEFTHHGDDCTFEHLLKRFSIRENALKEIGEMIHDADLEDSKFNKTECRGLHEIFKGLARLNKTDQEIIRFGLDCFDALYASLRKDI